MVDGGFAGCGVHDGVMTRDFRPDVTEPVTE